MTCGCSRPRVSPVFSASLNEAIARAEQGQIDAALGRNLIKQRIGRPGHRSGGYRTVIAYRVGDKAFFLFGFAKNERENINAADEYELAATGAWLLSLGAASIRHAIATGELKEITDDGEA